MKSKCLPLLPLLFISSCSFRGYTSNEIKCENHFMLVNDYKHEYEEEGDYTQFIDVNKTYIDTYYYKNEAGYNCHYHLEYKDNTIIDKWGKYSIKDNRCINITFEDNDMLNFEFSLYGSPSIDFVIIGTLKYNESTYHLIYCGYYIFSAKG